MGSDAEIGGQNARPPRPLEGVRSEGLNCLEAPHSQFVAGRIHRNYREIINRLDRYREVAAIYPVDHSIDRLAYSRLLKSKNFIGVHIRYLRCDG